MSKINDFPGTIKTGMIRIRESDYRRGDADHDKLRMADLIEGAVIQVNPEWPERSGAKHLQQIGGRHEESPFKRLYSLSFYLSHLRQTSFHSGFAAAPCGFSRKNNDFAIASDPTLS
jgi:hypothetical protein